MIHTFFESDSAEANKGAAYVQHVHRLVADITTSSQNLVQVLIQITAAGRFEQIHVTVPDHAFVATNIYTEITPSKHSRTP